jgi:hypothetical protein
MTDIVIKIVLVLGLLAGLFFGEQYVERLGASKQAATDQVRVDQLKQAATAELLALTNGAQALGTALQKTVTDQNLKDADHEKTLANLSTKLRAAMRLRDPHAVGCGGSSGGPPSPATGPADSSPADGSQTAGLLSAELSGLLQRLQSEADNVNAAYASCKSDAISIRALLSGISSSGDAPVSVVHSP